MNAITPGTTSFYDCAIPPLPAQEYQLIIDQTITIDQQAEPPYGTGQRFRITGPHLELGPNDVLAVRPPGGSQGAFDSWLPHVVLNDRTLPWQISPAGGSGRSHPAPGTPWMALLLLTTVDIDVAGAPPTPGSTGRQVIPLSQLLAPPGGITGPDSTAELTTVAVEQPGATVAVVDIRGDAFQAVCPTLAEIPFLAHVRAVDPTDQEALDTTAPGWYSVVVGNRFPVGAADGVYLAHLVSIEGHVDHLPGGAAASAGLVRLVSLASWSFTSTPDPGDFASLMQGLDVRPLAAPIQVTATDPAAQQIQQAISAGYSALRYLTRLGEETTGWYRGPLTPAPVAANPQPAFPSAAAALIYDPSTGMFDTSYAAAWELGRLLTLGNGPVTLSLAALVSSTVNASHLLLRDEPSRAAAEQTARRAAGFPGEADERPQSPPHASAGRRARALIAATIAPLLHRSRALGIAADPHGLRGRAVTGLAPLDVVHEIYDRGPDVYRRLRDRVLSDAATASDPDRDQEPAPTYGRPKVGRAAFRRARPAVARPLVPPHVALRRLASDPQTRAALATAASAVPADVSGWLDDLRALIGVPFTYLVPDARMLPAESVRFFAVDPDWVAALLDGALSVAGATAPAVAALSVLRPAILTASRRSVPPGRRSAPSTGDQSTATTGYSGFILRSAAVSDWPGLRVAGFADSNGVDGSLPIVRLERIAPTVLIALFAGQIARADLSEPPQHLHFGVGSESDPTVALRWIDPVRAGQQVPGDPVADLAMRTDAERAVVDIKGSVTSISTGLGTAYAPAAVPNLGSAALAIQLSIGAQAQSFRVGVAQVLLVNGTAHNIDVYVDGVIAVSNQPIGAIARVAISGSAPLQVFSSVPQPPDSSSARTDAPLVSSGSAAAPPGPLPAWLITGPDGGVTVTAVSDDPAAVAAATGRVVVAVALGGPTVDLAVDGQRFLTDIAAGSMQQVNVAAGLHTITATSGSRQWSAQLRINGASSTRLYVLASSGTDDIQVATMTLGTAVATHAAAVG